MARPLKPIDWNLVEKKMEAGCNGVEISGSLHIDTDTFYSRFKEEFGESFSALSANYHSGGKSNLKVRQYAKAMEGNINMLIWLGKNWLGQKDGQDNNQAVESLEKKQEEIMQFLKSSQASSERSIPSTNTKTE